MVSSCFWVCLALVLSISQSENGRSAVFETLLRTDMFVFLQYFLTLKSMFQNYPLISIYKLSVVIWASLISTLAYIFLNEGFYFLHLLRDLFQSFGLIFDHESITLVQTIQTPCGDFISSSRLDTPQISTWFDQGENKSSSLGETWNLL